MRIGIFMVSFGICTNYGTYVTKMAELLTNEEPNKKFFYHEHAAKLLKCLNETRERPNLCDATVTIGASRIPVQKNVLSAASHYFR